MTLTLYQQAILAAELKKAQFNGMTSAQAWTWLTAPGQQQTTQQVPSGAMLTPGVVALAIGPTKANAIASAFASAFPAIGSMIESTGVNPLDTTEVQPFLQSLVTAGTLTQTDFNTLVALGTTTQTVGPPGPRFDSEFGPVNWPSINPETGAVDPTGTSPPISGFPNCGSLLEADFDTCCSNAGRS